MNDGEIEFRPGIVEDAITSRHSVRGFLPRAVPQETLEHLLRVARWAPSGSNLQPWRLHVLLGESLAALGQELLARHDAHVPLSPEYRYYPEQWRSPYLERRRKAGLGLYQLAGVGKSDLVGAHRLRGRNFVFFGAPVGIVFTMDKTLSQGAWIETGMFMQTLMIAARGHGLDTCCLAAISNYPDLVHRLLGIADTEIVICGMALGWADPQEPANALRTEREELSVFVTFHR